MPCFTGWKRVRELAGSTLKSSFPGPDCFVIVRISACLQGSSSLHDFASSEFLSFFDAFSYNHVSKVSKAESGTFVLKYAVGFSKRKRVISLRGCFFCMTDKVDWFLQSGKYLHLIYIPCRHLRSYFIKSHLVCLLEDKPSFIAFGGGEGRMILGGKTVFRGYGGRPVVASSV